MPERKFIQSGGTVIGIETTGETVGDTALAPKFIDDLQTLAKSVADGLKGLKDAKPDEMRLEFGLSATGDGRFVIVQGTDAVNFKVRFTWGGPAAPHVDVPLPPAS